MNYEMLKHALEAVNYCLAKSTPIAQLEQTKIALQKEIDKPETKPEGWFAYDPSTKGWKYISDNQDKADEYPAITTPLYLRPTAKPLSEEEITRLANIAEKCPFTVRQAYLAGLEDAERIHFVR